MVQQVPAVVVVGGKPRATAGEGESARRGATDRAAVGVPMNHRRNEERMGDKPGGSNHREWATRVSRGLSA